MSKEIYISSTPQETRLAIVEKDELTEIYYERENEYTLAGSIYNGRVTRVLPGMQSSFVDIGLERDAFLYITDFMEEAADTADFEGAAASGEARAQHTDKPRSEGRTDSRNEGRGDRGRGRRDGRDNERRSRELQTDGARADVIRVDTPNESYDTFAPAQDDETLDALPPDDVDGIGEGAPGADGGRRWRGRRGRRRGRGVGVGAEADPESSADVPSVFASEDAVASQQVRAPRDGGRDRGGRDRGGRDRDRGGDRGGRTDRHDAVRERFAPRGPRPGADNDDVLDLNAAAQPAIEPLILPGESLSKYRRDEAGSRVDDAPVKPTAYAALRPSTEVVPLVGWDGGLVLPGETLRARSPRPEQQSQGRTFDGDRDDRRKPDQSQPSTGASLKEYSAPPRGLDPADAVAPSVTSQHDVAEREYEPQYPANEEQAHVEGSGLASEHEAEFQEAVEALHETEFQEITTEYEPEENASASFRVDPTGQREFRQSLTVDEPEIVNSGEAAPEVEHTDHIGTAAEPEFTSLQPTGEFISNVPEPPPAPLAQDEPTSPMEHESVVQSVHAAEAETSATPSVPPVFDEAPEEHTTGFAPGDGELEEELMEDDETEIPSIHASAYHDHAGDTEEETLEVATDLGSMIRDMTIDDMTRPEPAQLDEEDDDIFDEDEDFEEDELASSGEDDFEEDELSGSEVSEAEEEEFAEASSFEENGEQGGTEVEGAVKPREAGRDGMRRGRRDGRRGGRDRDRGGERSSDRGGDRDHGSDRNGSRDRRGMAGSRSGGRDRGHRSVQATNLPAISDLLKPGQEVLVQIAKEPIAKKGARITSHIALPGRFLVFMPTVHHTGVSRKIESDSERRRLKEILLSEKGDASGGFIVRTAAAGATEEELRSDLRFLLNLWADIKARSESSKSPALIYHDLNLVERVLRDQVTDNFSAIWVDTETEYERVLRFLQRFQPSLIRRVKLYTKDTPLFEQFGITEEINKALRAKVWLKSGGSIVINQTEALVAIDINTGKFVGKTTKLEDTILKTNLDAIPEIVRQIRLRDLGGIIIIDFIDMDERKNRNKVMAALEEELKSDRAPSKVLQFNDFGLVAITRKRVKQSLERTLSTTCGVCAGTGMVKSPVTVCNDIYIEMRKMHKIIEKSDMMLRVHPEVVKQLKANGGKWLQEMEEMSGKTILVKSDPTIHPEQFDIH